VYAKLVSEAQKPLELTEREKEIALENFWVSQEEALAYLDDKAASSGEDVYLFKRFLEGKENIFFGSGVLVNSGEFTGMDSEEAKQKITEKVGGRMTKTYRLRDWGVSRQRYWGCPIPLVHCESCGWQAAPELPVLLPEVEDYLPSDTGESPLAKNQDFVNTTCPNCNGPAWRETDTLDTFVDSSWYFLRYCDPKNEKTFVDKEKLQSFMPVNLYSGGAEHTTMHLLYSRFFHKALFDLGLVNEAEPYIKRMNRGLILGPDGNKMSKSKGNVIDPDAIIAELGADTMRMYLAFIGPYNEIGAYPWNPEAVIGVRRFLDRVWRLALKQGEVVEEDSKKIERVLHKAIQEVEESIANLKMNTGVAALMIATNELTPFPTLTQNQIKMYLQILAPYAPHIAEELWHELGESSSIHQAAWPVFDESKLVESIITIPVQINGKVRAIIDIAPNTPEVEVEALVLADEKVIILLDGKKPKRVIVIPGKIVSIVV
jgi:leucyl-tRNA synthetase